MEKNIYTHKVAVTAYIIKNDKFLLLKRNTNPLIWAPPGGHLKRDENPNDGIKREIKEETNLDIEIIAPVDIWFGTWKDKPLLSIDYLVKVSSDDLQLSNEHSEYYWVSMEELTRGDPIKLDPELGFLLKDFRNAHELIQLMKKSGYHL